MQDRRGVVATRARGGAVERVALLSVHTCPLDQPGVGDSGGMNVYVRQVSRRLADVGVAVDVFTRATGQRDPVTEVAPGVRVVHLSAGPAHPVPKGDLTGYLDEFLYALLRFEAAEAARIGVDEPIYDLVHSNYWLSGWVGRHARERWARPLVQSFHTLGRVKNRSLSEGERPEPPARIAQEERIVHAADCILAPTADEATDLVRLYGAPPDRVRVVSPGVDTDVFSPGSGDRAAAKRAVGLPERPLILFVGRLQPLKAPDVAVRALAELVRRCPTLDPTLRIMGGPSGAAATDPDTLLKLAADSGVADRVQIHEPMPHPALATYYRAADVVVVPSHSESFGLVALEAAACGTPVVASDVGGLRTTVCDGRTGILVPPGDPTSFAAALERILTNPGLADAMSCEGARFAAVFDWRTAAAGLLSVYEDLVARADAGGAALP